MGDGFGSHLFGAARKARIPQNRVMPQRLPVRLRQILAKIWIGPYPDKDTPTAD